MKFSNEPFEEPDDTHKLFINTGTRESPEWTRIIPPDEKLFVTKWVERHRRHRRVGRVILFAALVFAISAFMIWYRNGPTGAFVACMGTCAALITYYGDPRR